MADESTPESTGPKQYVTPLTAIEHQVGSNVIAALQDPENVAVLSTVMAGPNGHQHVVSIGMGPQVAEKVHALVAEAHGAKRDRVPCVGFHCFLNEDELEADDA